MILFSGALGFWYENGAELYGTRLESPIAWYWARQSVGQGGVFGRNDSVKQPEASAGCERHRQPLGRKVSFPRTDFVTSAPLYAPVVESLPRLSGSRPGREVLGLPHMPYQDPHDGR